MQNDIWLYLKSFLIKIVKTAHKFSTKIKKTKKCILIYFRRHLSDVVSSVQRRDA